MQYCVGSDLLGRLSGQMVNKAIDKCALATVSMRVGRGTLVTDCRGTGVRPRPVHGNARNDFLAFVLAVNLWQVFIARIERLYVTYTLDLVHKMEVCGM